MDTGWSGEDEGDDASVVGIGLGCGRNEDGKEDHGSGLEKFGALAAMARRRASTCFAFMLPKNQIGQLTCSHEPRGHCARGVSNKGVSSSDFLGTRLQP